jgi:nucleoside-diphosphate-sugar epimerase
MKTLVTGGTGYLGTHIRKYFGADDLSRRSGRDILNLQDVKVVSDYDVVIHLAAHLDKTPSAASQVFLTNVEGTVNVLREVRKDAVFIFASTKDVYGRFADNFREVPETCPTLYSGQSALEWSKLIAERYVEFFAHQKGFRAGIFRLSTIFAPPADGTTPNFVGYYADSINKGDPIILPANGRPIRDLLYVDDLARACENFTESAIRHGLYNIGGGRQNALTLRDLVSRLERVSGLQAVLDDESTDSPKPVPLNFVSDISAASREIGWEPSIGLDDALANLFELSHVKGV